MHIDPPKDAIEIKVATSAPLETMWKALVAKQKNAETDYPAEMFKGKVLKTFERSGLWSDSLCVYEFEHTMTGSRSGDGVVSVICCPNESGEREDRVIAVVIAHHEGAESYTFQRFKHVQWHVATNDQSDDHQMLSTIEHLNTVFIINTIVTLHYGEPINTGG